MKGLLNQENLFVLFEEGYHKSKSKTKEMIKFLLDNSIEASQFLLKCNIIIESLTQNSPKSSILIDESMKKIYKIFENTKKNIKNELKKALHLIISFLKSTYFEDRVKMNLDQSLNYLSNLWKEALDNDYRVTTNRREKVYDLINILESDYNTLKNSKINPNFYRDSTITKNGFYAQSLSKATYSKRNEEFKENENKTNLLHMDSSRDNIGIKFLNTTSRKDEGSVSNFSIPAEKSKQKLLPKQGFNDKVFMIDEYDEIKYHDDKSKQKEKRKRSNRSYRSYGRSKEESSSLRETSESMLKSYDTDDLRVIRASKFRSSPRKKKKEEEDFMVIEEGSSMEMSTPESQQTHIKTYDTPSGFESQKMSQKQLINHNKDPEIYYVKNYKKSAKSRKKKRKKRKKSLKKKKSLHMETMKPLQIMVLKESMAQEETSGVSESENSTEIDQNNHTQSLLNLNESSIRSLGGGMFLQNLASNKKLARDFGKKTQAQLERILPDNINDENLMKKNFLQNSDLHQKFNNIQVEFNRNQNLDQVQQSQSITIRKQKTMVKTIVEPQENHKSIPTDQGNFFLPNLMGTQHGTQSNSHTSGRVSQQTDLYLTQTEESNSQPTKKLYNKNNQPFSAPSNNLVHHQQNQNSEKNFGTIESFKNLENRLSSVKKKFSPLSQKNTDPFNFPSASPGQQQQVAIPQQQNVQNFNPSLASLGNSSQISHSTLVKTLVTNSLVNSEVKQNHHQPIILEQSERFFANESFGYPANLPSMNSFNNGNQSFNNAQSNQAFNSKQSPNKISDKFNSHTSHAKSSARSKKSQNSPLQRPFGSPNSNFIGLKDLSKVEDPENLGANSLRRAFGDLTEEVIYTKNEYAENNTKKFFAKFIVEEHNLDNSKLF